jgi:hypothetical protein
LVQRQAELIAASEYEDPALVAGFAHLQRRIAAVPGTGGIVAGHDTTIVLAALA